VTAEAPLRILLVHDELPPNPRPDELDSLAQAASIAETLHVLGHEVETLASGYDLGPLAARLTARPPDLVFNTMESLGGHTRLLATVPRLAEALGVPVAGCSAEGIHVSSHKVLAKRILSDAGLPTPAWRTLEQLRAGEGLPGPVILKSAWEHASIGIDDAAVLADGGDAAAVAARLEARLPALGGEGFVEAYIDGRELVVGLLPPGPDDDPATPLTLPPSELEFIDWPADKPKLIGFACKWDEDSLEYERTVRRLDFEPRDHALLADLQQLAVAAWRALDLRGHARVDFRVDLAGRPWILEVNANPCITPDAGFSAMAERPGIAYDDMIRRIVRAAAIRAPRREAEDSVNAAEVDAASNREHRCVPLRAEDVDAVQTLAAPHAERVRGLADAALAGTDDNAPVCLIARGKRGAARGFACAARTPETATGWTLQGLTVAADARRAGVGTALLRALEQTLASRGATHVYADLTSADSDADARVFFERTGWSLVARLYHFHAMGTDKLLYARQIAR